MKYVPKAVTRTIGLSILRTKKNSPQLLFAAGLVGFGATVVLACKATMKVENVLTDHEKSNAGYFPIRGCPEQDDRRQLGS